jgi:inner membrane protein
MPTVFSHALAGAAIGVVSIDGRHRRPMWGLGALCAIVPDIDVIAFLFGIPYDHPLGHRGLSHSLLFAAALAWVVAAVVRWARPTSPGGFRLWAFFFLATASHGLLDAMTNGGLGVAFFAPFSDARYFLPWQPIIVSPISVGGLLSRRGLRVIWSELGWVWLPAALVMVAGFGRRRRPGTPDVETRTPRTSS